MTTADTDHAATDAERLAYVVEDDAATLGLLGDLLAPYRRVVLLHYSPIEGTVEGEPKEIYPYLGSSRLEEPLTRYPVDAVFHGHAHHGTAEGRTKTGVPVYNVSIVLLQHLHPDGWPVRLLEVPTEGAADSA